MYYKLTQNTATELPLEDLSTEQPQVGYLTLQELKNDYEKLGIDKKCVIECERYLEQASSHFDVYDHFSFGLLSIVDVKHIKNKRDKIAFLLKKNLFVMIEIVDEDHSTRRIWEEIIRNLKTNVTLEKLICIVFERLIEDGTQVLNQAEEQIMEMEKELVENKASKTMNHKIFTMRNNLTIRKNYYESLITIGEALHENENGLFAQKQLRYFKIFTARVERLSRHTQMLCENLIHLREAYQAALEYSLNNIMKLFTVVTTIFSPLTLIVGWYGMNFKTMPELAWKYGYLFVIILSITVVFLCVWIFKKKKLF